MAGDRFYGSARWRRLRAQHLALFPLCETCRAEEGRIVPARAVDHRIAISQGGDPFPPHEGLASLCLKHHAQKTARSAEAGAVKSNRPKKGCNPDGSPLDPSHPWHGGDDSRFAESRSHQPPSNPQTQLVSRRRNNG